MPAMKRLILFRHAKSSWADGDIEDHDRRLNARGRLAAPLMGAWLAGKEYRPERVLCSSSLRTRETWDGARGALAGTAPPEIEPRLYHADPATMLALVRATPEAVGTLLLLGHQPGIGAFARKLSRPDAPAHCARAFVKFPTAAIAVIDFEAADWDGVAFGEGRFHAFACPRELV